MKGAGGRHADRALFADLYELTMVQGYLEEGLSGEAVFTVFVRRLPECRNFLLACGLDAVLGYLERLRFTDEDVAYLRSLGRFSNRLFDWLLDFRFEGSVYALPEGTPVFANEPILEIVAPVSHAQLVETAVMNQIHVHTVMASKGVRCVMAARGRTVIDFGARRTHGIDASLDAARAFHIAGIHGTSNVLAGKIYGLPLAGTMAHSYVQAHHDEREAFRAFARMFPGTTLLVDTYDTLTGVQRVIELAGERGGDFQIGAIRLDSGDLGTLAREARGLLDTAGLKEIRIFASSDLDEYGIAALVKADAPIDGFGVGTAMGVSSDAPFLDIVYKLSEYAGEGRMKVSRSKSVLPGRKQVFRLEEHGRGTGDVIGRLGEALEGRQLLRLVMQQGRRTSDGEDGLDAARRRAAEELARLPSRVTSLERAEPPYQVSISTALEQFAADVHKRVVGG
jgi:nicotinate phosphoribosyltransferase